MRLRQSMDVIKEIKTIRGLLELSQKELADDLNVSIDTIKRWENEYVNVEKENIEKIFSYAFKNGIYINKIYEQIYKEQYQKEANKVLFHGAKRKLELPVDLSHSKYTNDFGNGFYLGEKFEQASAYISNGSGTDVYVFKLDISNLNVIHFNVDQEWMIAIAYYRGQLKKYENHKYIQNIIEKINKADVIVAPIVDNRMFQTISEFIEGYITDLQCQHSLSATILGRQYVLKTNKAIDALDLISTLYLCDEEKKSIYTNRLKDNLVAQDKVKIARIEFKNQGKYIDEVLK